MPRELERLLVHPLTLIAIALWALNDHVLKAALGNGLTGKLSDVTSLMVAPTLLTSATAVLGLFRRHTRELLWFWCVGMAAVMATINCFDWAADAYRLGLGLAQWPLRCALALSLRPLARVELTMDPTDLWTIPCAATSALLLHRQTRRSRCDKGAGRGARLLGISA